jgi:hypothetical protein
MKLNPITWVICIFISLSTYGGTVNPYPSLKVFKDMKPGLWKAEYISDYSDGRRTVETDIRCATAEEIYQSFNSGSDQETQYPDIKTNGGQEALLRLDFPAAGPIPAMSSFQKINRTNEQAWQIVITNSLDANKYTVLLTYLSDTTKKCQ